MYLVPGVLLRKDVSLLLACYMGVDLRCHNRAMSKQLLDIPNINTLIQQQRCKRVPEHMWCDMAFYASQLAVFIDNGSN